MAAFIPNLSPLEKEQLFDIPDLSHFAITFGKNSPETRAGMNPAPTYGVAMAS